MSTNITVSCRRSGWCASTALAQDRGASCLGTATVSPQPPQYLSVGTFANPHRDDRKRGATSTAEAATCQILALAARTLHAGLAATSLNAEVALLIKIMTTQCVDSSWRAGPYTPPTTAPH